MGREERTIEVKVISATDLKKVMKFGREQKCYVVAYVYPARKEISPTDFYGGVNPVWNAILKVRCYETDIHPATSSPSAGPSTSSPSAHMMTLEIYSHVSGVFHKTDKLVGTVTVPLQHVASAAKTGGDMSAFEVRLATGGGQGSLNLSVKLGAKRELGEYEDLSAPISSSYSGDQEAPPSIYPRASGKVPSTQPGSQTTQGQSSYGIYPPTSDHSAAWPNKNPFAAEGQSSYGNDPPTSKNPFATEGQSSYGNNPPTSKNPFAAEGQSSYGHIPPTSKNPFAAEAQSSYGNNPPPTRGYPTTPPNPSSSAAAADDVVTGYPAPEYTFAPLGQLPRPGQQQARPYTTGSGPYATYAPERQGQYGLDTTQHGPYATLSPSELTRRQGRKQQKSLRKAGRGRKGPIHLGLGFLQATLVPMMMGGGRRPQVSNAPDAPSSSSSQPGQRPQDSTNKQTKGQYS